MLTVAAAMACVCKTEKDSLQAIYWGLNGPGWTHSDNWLSNASICTWYGVQCDSKGRVQVLNLSNNNLMHQLPEEIECFEYIKVLDLSTNKMSSNITGSLCKADTLVILNLSSAGFSGTLPSCMCKMTKMQYIYLDNNLFEGPIPSYVDHWHYAREIYMQCNNFNGTVPRKQFNEIKCLQVLDVTCNEDLYCDPYYGCGPAQCHDYFCGMINCEKCTINQNQCPAFVAVTNCGNYYRAA